MRLKWKLFTGLGALGALAILLAAVPPVNAEQKHMENALSALQRAKSQLEQASHNKGGHRGNAIEHVERAIRQVEKGMEYAETHGSGSTGRSSGTPGSLEDLVGTSARHIDSKMRGRGYVARDTWLDGDHRYAAWEEQENGNCVRVAVSGGRVARIENTSRKECGQ